MASTVIAFRWRTSADEPLDQWRRGSEEWQGGTVDALRRRLAPMCGSTVALASVHDPELWQCDEEGHPVARQDATGILEWLPADAPAILWERHANRQRKAVLVFTFPPAETAAEPAAKRLRLEATTVTDLDWATERARAHSFFQRLADPATLQLDANGYLYLPEHPSMAMSTRRRFDVITDSLGQTTVPLLSRSLAGEYETAMLEQCVAAHNFLYVHGAQGVGKSYALYEAVCRLMAQRNKVRVIYMHDCSAWEHDAPVANLQMARVVATAFDPDVESALWTACEKVSTYAQLRHLIEDIVVAHCQALGLQLVAVFDQHNGLAVDLRARLPWGVPERVLPTLASWKGIGATVISASANNEYYLKVAVDASWRRLDCFQGFTGDELEQWRRHHHFFDGPEHAAAWDDVTALIANWPLDLNDMRQNRKASLAETLEWHRDRRIYAIEDREATHLRVHVTDPSDRQSYAGIVLEMLIGRDHIRPRYPEAQRLINKHILYYHASDDSVRPIHDLARQFYLVRGYLKLAGDLGDATIKDVLASLTATADTKGRVLELYVTGCMASLQTFQLQARPVLRSGHLGTLTIVFNARALRIQYFPSQSVPSGLPWTTSMLLVPLNSNYPGVDLLLWDAQDRLLLAIQITVRRIRDHSMSFTAGLQAAWKQASGARELRFAWLAPAADVTRVHAGQYYISLQSIQADLAPLVAHYEAA